MNESSCCTESGAIPSRAEAVLPKANTTAIAVATINVRRFMVSSSGALAPGNTIASGKNGSYHRDDHIGLGPKKSFLNPNGSFLNPDLSFLKPNISSPASWPTGPRATLGRRTCGFAGLAASPGLASGVASASAYASRTGLGTGGGGAGAAVVVACGGAMVGRVVSMTTAAGHFCAE